FVLVEGAGGVMAPMDESRTMRDLMKRLRLPVVVVARRGLGTINHSLLSLLALKEGGLDVFGIVFNETQNIEPDYIRKDNPTTVAAIGGVRILGNIDYMDKFDDAAWRRFESQFTSLPALLERIQAS
ncbi:MAG: ATP-dependent dethiobiotin synthetase BioD, partial [Candidatus Hydrogenedentales bacterium]